MRALFLVSVFLAVAFGVGSQGDHNTADAAPSPTRILYSSDWALATNQIYAVDPTGRMPMGRLTFPPSPPCTRWTANSCGFEGPNPSPNGRWVLQAFHYDVDYALPDAHRVSLFVSRADGRGRRLVAEGVVAATHLRVPHDDELETVWSPDSRRFAYEAGGLHVFRTDGTPVRLRPYRALPEWIRFAHRSPDWRWEVVAGKDAFELLDWQGKFRRKTIRLDIGDFAWSPNSRWLAFSSFPDGIFVVDLRSLRVRQLTQETGSDLSWSPDSTSVAFVSRGIRVVTLTGRVRTVVDARGDFGARIGSLAWTRPPPGVRYRRAPTGQFPMTEETLEVPWDVERLASDGDRVALVSCGNVFVWSPSQTDLALVGESQSLTPKCATPEYPIRWLDVYSLALAGDRLVVGEWTGNTGQTGTLREIVLVNGRRASAVELGYSLGTFGTPWGPFGEAQGEGELLIFSKWSERCPTSCRTSIVTVEQAIHRVEEGGCPCPTLRSEPGPLVPFDVGGNRVVAGGDNALVVLDPDGRELLSMPVRAAAALISGPDLAVLVRGTLRHHNAETGELLHAWPLPNVSSGKRCATPNMARCEDEKPRLMLEDAARGLVAYVVDKQVHILRLADGADVVIAAGQAAAFIDSGVVYASGARLRLVRFDELPLR